MSIKRRIASFLVCLAAAFSLQAQERFSDMIAVTEVEVPVRVLIKGKPLAGLTRADFEVYDQDELQSIVGFEVRDLWGSRDQKPVDAPSLTTADPRSRRLLLLIDFSFSRRQRLAHALKGIRSALDSQLHPTDRVAVATWGYVSGLNLLVGFTDDREKLHLALDAVQAMLDAKRKKQQEILARLHAARFSVSPAGDGSSTYKTLAGEMGNTAALAVLTGPVVYDEAEDDGVDIRQQNSFFGPIKVRVEIDVSKPIDVAQDVVDSEADVSSIRALGLSLAELATLLKDVGGQKDILLLSEGFAGNLLTDAHSLFYLQKSFRAMRDSGWTLHAIDVGGIPGLGETSFASSSLLFMADATGGDLIENTNNFSVATAKVLQRTGIVYVLTFQPTQKGDSERSDYHQLDVKLKNPPKGVQIIHRPGYYTARPPANREVFEQRVDAAEWLLANLEASELEVQVFAQTISDPQGRGTRVPVAVEVTGSSLLATKTKKPSRLELQMAVFDSESRVREVLNGELKIDFGDHRETLNRGGVRFVGELGLPPGDYQLRVLVRSRKKGEVFLSTFPLSVGLSADSQLPPPPPSVERPPDSWVTVQAEQRSAYFQ